jgi:alpha-L-fucosidase
MDEIAAFGRQLQPGLIIADRTVGGRHENFVTPEQTVPERPLGCPWESCVTMGPTFSYGFHDVYKPLRQVLHLLIDIVAKGGNLLLNVAPSPEGRFAPEALVRLREIGDWMAVHGEGIYATRAIAPYQEGDLRFTRRGDTVYAFALAPPTGSTLTLRALQPADGAPVRLLGHATPLAWTRHDDRVEVQLPPAAALHPHAWAVTFPLAPAARPR